MARNLSVGQPTGRGEGASSRKTYALKPGKRLKRSSGRSTHAYGSPRGKPRVRSLREVEDVPKTVPLDFTEDDVTWVASKLSGAAGALGAEAIEIRS